MRILITGGTGMIGTALANLLVAEGHQVCVLTRDPGKVQVQPGLRALGWDGRSGKGWGEILSQMDAVVNLVGERLSKWPWTAKQKDRFLNSRVNGGLALAEAFQVASPRPKVFVQASGINYYGPHDLVPITEADPAGKDFLADLCKAWEDATAPVEQMGVRRVIVRSAIVLSAQDGILPIMMFPVKLFLGGSLGNGKQGLPWIHLEDEVAAIHFLLENQSAAGPYNLTSPIPISSADFMRVLAKQLHRPYWLPVPDFVIHSALGGMSTLILDGMYPLPKRLLDLGFIFRFENAESALHDLLIA